MQLISNAVTAGILAGGAGRRMGGADKGWVQWHGRAMVMHVATALRPQCSRLLISANRNLQAYESVGDRVLRDAESGFNGPLAGVLSLLKACTQRYLLLAPVDAVRLPLDLLDRLAAPGAAIAVASLAGRLHYPCCLIDRVRVRAPDNAEGSMRDWMRGQDMQPVDMPPDAILSLNTLAELADTPRSVA